MRLWKVAHSFIHSFFPSLIPLDDKVFKSTKPIDNGEVSMDMFRHIAMFPALKINISTRMHMISLKFVVQIAGRTAGASEFSPLTVESQATFPLVVITNESQWCEAAGKKIYYNSLLFLFLFLFLFSFLLGKLLFQDSFVGQAEVTWPKFANTLQHHFYKITRQDPERPSRQLQQLEFQYMHEKYFDNQSRVSSQQAIRCWQWFGHICQTLRFKRHIGSLWFSGLIYGIVPKGLCNHYLQNQQQGTFLIRFSDSVPGQFSVAYVTDDQYDPVKHYLIKAGDISANKSLPDFIREKTQFQHLFKLDPENNVLSRIHKDQAFGSYYSKSSTGQQNAGSGYVVNL